MCQSYHNFLAVASIYKFPIIVLFPLISLQIVASIDPPHVVPSPAMKPNIESLIRLPKALLSITPPLHFVRGLASNGLSMGEEETIMLVIHWNAWVPPPTVATTPTTEWTDGRRRC
ncbi:hypothetical protein U1Q18_039661 [Sarracenia purpurea var. burkii]